MSITISLSMSITLEKEDVEEKIDEPEQIDLENNKNLAIHSFSFV